MAVKRYKPTSAARRFMTVPNYKEQLSGDKAERSLLEDQRKSGGRNNAGRITVRHIGGGNKRKYRVIDFKRNKDGIPATVKSIQYDPNRSANIALLVYADGEKRYILAPVGLNVGDKVTSGFGSDIKVGNALALKDIPVGTMVHNIEIKPGRGAQVARAAGISAQIMACENGYATIKMPSGEMRLIPAECRATIGQVGNVPTTTLTAAAKASLPSVMQVPKRLGASPLSVTRRERRRTRRANSSLRGSTEEDRSNVEKCQERALRRSEAFEPHRGHERSKRKESAQDLVESIDDLPSDGRSHDRRLRRQEARSRIYHGGHGGLQARRVRSHENVPRSYGEDHVA